MGLIRDFLIDRKFYEAVDEVEQILEEKGIDHNSVIHAFTFNKEIFPEEKDARIWAREKGFEVYDFESDDKSHYIQQLDLSEFVESSLQSIEIANGVEAVVGLIYYEAIQNQPADVYLSLRNEKSIKLSSNLPHIIELAKVVKGFHAAYGEVVITGEMLQSFVRNFSEGVVGVDLMIDYDHDQGKAAGWIKSVFLSADGQTLFGEVKWTPKGAQTLSDRDFRYYSPEFTLNYVHPHTGQAHGATLLGGGLVNRPFLKMDAIVSFKEKNINQENEDLIMETIALNEHKVIVSDLEKQIADFKLGDETIKKVIDGQKEEIKTLSETVKTLEGEKAQKELEAKNTQLFNDGKINKAQLDAMNDGKDIFEVLNLSENMNVEPKGKDGNNDSIELSESDLEAIQTLGLTKEDYIKYNL